MTGSAVDGVTFGELATASGHVFGHATLDAPTTLNALTLPMIDALAARFLCWRDDPRVAGVLLDAAGERAFCAGGDVVALYRAIRAADGGVPAEASAFFEREYRLDHAIHTYPKPVLCWGHGIVMGGGVGLMAGASHRVATERTKIAMPEISIGLYPDVGGSWILGRMPGRIGAFLALTGAPLNASDAMFCGIADFVVAHDAKAKVIHAIGTTSWCGDREADGAALSHAIAAFATAKQAGSPARTHFDRIADVIDHDRLTDIAPRLAALADDADPWLSAAGQAFARGSPTSAALSLKLLDRAKHLSLAEVFRLEFRASIGCCVRHDFAEGVRALLVDKDRSPRWSPARTADIDPDDIDDHLTPRFDGAHPLADLNQETQEHG